MSGDGAHLGVDAERALQTVIGGAPQPSNDERMTVAEMRRHLLSAPLPGDEAAMASYGEAARAAAGAILRWAMANPTRFARAEDPYDTMKADRIALDELGLTGFQWGWALNAARRCLELGPVPNPAILMTIDLGDEHGDEP